MLPDMLTIVLFIIVSFLIAVIGVLLPRKIGGITEITLACIAVVYMFISYPFSEASILVSFAAMAYGNLESLIEKDKAKKRRELKEKLRNTDAQIIDQKKDIKRIFADLMLAMLVSGGAVLFLIFAPMTYSLLKFFIIFGLLFILTQMIARVGNFYSSKLYWLPQEERLVILSIVESRDFPLKDIKEIRRESAPDLLQIHPVFTFLSANQDYTRSFQEVLRLSFPGEDIYITPDRIAEWEDVFREYLSEEQKDKFKKVLPVWHPANLKRLFWKGYFAVTVKGISAYTGLLFLLIWWEVPAYMMIGFVLLWWFVNLYLSDRVLIAGTDATEVTNGELGRRANVIFKKAGVPHTKLFMIDSPVYNGMATGMHIGRGTVMLTKATMELPVSAFEAIIAHETVHVKKRDVLTNQLARALFLALIALVVYLFFDQIESLAENLFVFIPMIYILMMLFPLYLSLISQWTEVRADHMGTDLLEGGREQMKNGLRALGEAQDQAVNKTVEYSTAQGNKARKNHNSTERDSWFLRFIEFKFMLHPPLYWRIFCLSCEHTWPKARKAWLIARMKESLPDARHRKDV